MAAPEEISVSVPPSNFGVPAVDAQTFRSLHDLMPLPNRRFERAFGLGYCALFGVVSLLPLLVTILSLTGAEAFAAPEWRYVAVVSVAVVVIGGIVAVVISQLPWILRMQFGRRKRREKCGGTNSGPDDEDSAARALSDLIEFVVVTPTYNEPTDLIQEQVEVLAHQGPHSRRCHLVLCLEGAYWGKKGPSALLAFQAAVASIVRPKWVVADEDAGACHFQCTTPGGSESDASLEADDPWEHIATLEDDACTAAAFGNAPDAFSLFKFDDAGRGEAPLVASLHFYMHPAVGEKRRRPDELQGIGSNQHWGFRQLCRFRASRLSERAGDILRFPGRAVVAKLDAGVMCDHDFLRITGEAFLKHWLCFQEKEGILFGIAKSGSSEPDLESQADHRLRVSLRRNLDDFRPRCPPLLLAPFILHVFGLEQAIGLNRIFACLLDVNNMAVAGLRWMAYCSYSVPFVDLVRVGGWHADLVAEDLTLSGGMECLALRDGYMRTTRWGVDTLVYKAIPIGESFKDAFREFLTQQLRFERGFAWAYPCIVQAFLREAKSQTLGRIAATKWIIFYLIHDLSLGGLSTYLNLFTILLVAGFLKEPAVASMWGWLPIALLALAGNVILTVFLLCPLWVNGMFKEARRKDLCPSQLRGHAVYGEGKVFYMMRICFLNVLWFPAWVVMSMYIVWTALATGFWYGWKGQSYKPRKKYSRGAGGSRDN